MISQTVSNPRYGSLQTIVYCTGVSRPGMTVPSYKMTPTAMGEEMGYSIQPRNVQYNQSYQVKESKTLQLHSEGPHSRHGGLHNVIWCRITVKHGMEPSSASSRTRSQHSLKFRQIPASSDYSKFSFFPCTVRHWTSLPTRLELSGWSFKLELSNMSM